MRWQRIVPITVVVALIALLGYGLTRNPTQLPSALVGKTVPQFSLPTLASARPVLTNADLEGQVTVINTFASWCLTCRVEHPHIAQLVMRTGVPVIGLDYKDKRPAALKWLHQFGDPFAAVIFDKQGQLGFDLGVGAVPESYVVDSNGVIRHKVVGPITPEIMNETLIPLIKRLKQEAA